MRIRRQVTTDRWSWVDLRLVPPAATVWVLTLVTGRWTPAPLLLTGGLCAVGATALLVRAGRRGPPRWAAGRAVAVGCLAVAVATSVLAAERSAGRAASPLLRLAAEGSVVAVVLRVDDHPRPVTGAEAPRVLVAATVREAGTRPVAAGAVLLFGPAQQWSAAAPGQVVRLRAAVRPAGAGDEVVAVLSARSPPVRVDGPGPLQAVAGALREGLVASAGRVLPPLPAGLLPGLVVGDTRALDPALAADSRRSGLSHLTTVSGDTVGCQ